MKLLKIFLIINLIILDGVVGYNIYKSQITNSNRQIITNNQVPIIQYNDLNEINAKLVVLQDRIVNLELTPYPSPAGLSGQVRTQTVPTRTPVRSTAYVAIPGNGETKNNSWSDITGTDFYFDKTEYPGILSVTMEGNIKLFNGSGTGYIRLYDVTHGFAVVGSEVNTTSQTDTLTSSGTLNFWSGRNLYRVQGKSNSSDRLIYNWGKLKITQQF